MTETIANQEQPLHRRQLAHPLRILFAASLAFAYQADALACESHFLCVSHERDNGAVLIRAENRSAVPLTYTVRLRVNEKKQSKTVTRTLRAGQSEVAITAPLNRDQRYRMYYDWTVGNLSPSHDDSYLYRLPYEDGKSYRVIQSFGSRFSHTGLEQFAIDFRMREGTPIHAARGGTVARLEESHSIGCWEDGCGKYANFVVILHDDGTTGEYYHLSQDGVLVEMGDTVRAGQRIALSGNTGHTTVPHLHFAVYRAVEWGETQSVPIRFASADGIVDRPRRGGRYQATAQPRHTATQNVPTGYAME